MISNDVIWIGNRHIWGGEQPFGLSRLDRRQHLYVIGKTGTGKTTLLRNMLLQTIEAGEGVGVIDPHGDLAEDLLEHIPPWRTDHVVYFNPADQDYPIAFNLFQPVASRSRHLIASSIVGAFKSIWRDSWGPRLEYVLSAAVSALLECQNTTIFGVQRMLTDRLYREWVLRQVRDPVVRNFWVKEYESYDNRFLSEVIAPIQNKVGQLLMAAPLRNILGQVGSKFSPRFTMDNRRIVIANLSKGLLGEDKANLLGALLVSQFQTAAMMRADRSENDRVDFHLFVDEFHNFATDSFAGILAEMRKYALCLVLSHQHLEQVRPEVRHAIFGNVGSMIAFRVGESDAQVVSREFGDGFDPSQSLVGFANLVPINWNRPGGFMKLRYDQSESIRRLVTNCIAESGIFDAQLKEELEPWIAPATFYRLMATDQLLTQEQADLLLHATASFTPLEAGLVWSALKDPEHVPASMREMLNALCLRIDGSHAQELVKLVDGATMTSQTLWLFCPIVPLFLLEDEIRDGVVVTEFGRLCPDPQEATRVLRDQMERWHEELMNHGAIERMTNIRVTVPLSGLVRMFRPSGPFRGFAPAEIESTFGSILHDMTERGGVTFLFLDDLHDGPAREWVWKHDSFASIALFESGLLIKRKRRSLAARVLEEHDDIGIKILSQHLNEFLVAERLVCHGRGPQEIAEFLKGFRRTMELRTCQRSYRPSMNPN